MTRIVQFVICKRGGKWSVKAADLERRFTNQREAVKAAIELAHESGRNGKPSMVLLQKTKSQFEEVWTYGRDPYPLAALQLPGAAETPVVVQTRDAAAK